MSNPSTMLEGTRVRSGENQSENVQALGLKAGEIGAGQFGDLSLAEQKTILASMLPKAEPGKLDLAHIELFDTAKPTNIESFFKAVDADENGHMSADELNSASKQIRFGQSGRELARDLLKQSEVMQGFSDDAGLDSKGISRADLTTKDGQQMIAWLQKPDVQKMHSVLQSSISEMVSSGERKAGSGVADRWWNNLNAKLVDDKILECYGQAERVLQNINNAGLAGKWDMHLVGDLSTTGTIAMAVGSDSPGHFRVEMVPRQKGDPIVIIDPWKNQIELKDPASYKASESYHSWTTTDGHTMFGNYEEQFRNSERPKMFAQWQQQGKPEGDFNTWLRNSDPQLAKALDPYNRGKEPKTYGLSEYWEQKFQ